jgi:hypothetical protein
VAPTAYVALTGRRWPLLAEPLTCSCAGRLAPDGDRARASVFHLPRGQSGSVLPGVISLAHGQPVGPCSPSLAHPWQHRSPG